MKTNSFGTDSVVFFDCVESECTLTTEPALVLEEDDFEDGEELLWSGANDVELDEEDLCVTLERFRCPRDAVTFLPCGLLFDLRLGDFFGVPFVDFALAVRFFDAPRFFRVGEEDLPRVGELEGENLLGSFLERLGNVGARISFTISTSSVSASFAASVSFRRNCASMMRCWRCSKDPMWLT